ncbi:Phosphatase and actin regulator 3, partial [Pterocles gutturalis]
DEMEHSPAMHSDYLVSGIRTPPVRRNSKLATLGRIFKPWKWRKKKNEKLKQTSAVLEKKMTARQGRDELIKKGLLEMMEQASAESASICEQPRVKLHCPCFGDESSQQVMSPCLLTQPETPAAQTHCAHEAAQPGTLLFPLQLCSPGANAASLQGNSLHPARAMKSPPSTILKNYVIVGSSQISGQAALFHPSGQKSSDPHVRGQVTTPTGSPHLAAVHLPLPPSRVIEELHRALATKHRQDSILQKLGCAPSSHSFHGRESKGSPKKRVDVRPSRTSSIERNKEKENSLSYSSDSENKRNSVKESDENKENMIMNSELTEEKCKKELLAVKLRNRPSKQELEDRNIFPRRTDEERQEIRQQIEMKLSKRLSQRPAVEELERRNILKQRNDQTEQEERREIKQRLTRKLNQRPTVDELRDRKILIRFSDYVEVAKAQDYDRRADKPWTRLSAADKAAIRKELNEYKSNEMEVHASSKHLTR